MTTPLRFTRHELAGAFGDLGTDLPLLVGVTIVLGLDPTTVFVVFGLLQIATGWFYRLPMPVQPLKAMAAIAIAGQVTAPELLAGGLIVGVVMLALAGSGLLDAVARAVPTVVVRGIQFGLGLALARLALGTYIADDGTVGWLFGGVLLLIALTLAGHRRWPGSLVIVAIGLAAAALTWPDGVAGPFALHLPSGPLGWPTGDDFGRAALVLALPQLALSLGNSVLATRQVAQDFFPERTPPSIRRIGTSYGLMNLVAAPLGGMPVCHGSGGFAGHYAFGGRTGGSVVLYGAFYLAAGFALSGDPVAFQRLFPGPVLGVLLLVESVTLIALIRDQASSPRAIRTAALVGLTAIYAPYGYAVALLGGTVLWRLAERLVPQTATAAQPTGPSADEASASRLGDIATQRSSAAAP